MFKASPIESKDEQRALCERLGAEYRPGDFAYAVSIDGEEAGIVTFFIKGKQAFLRQIVFREDKKEFDVMFICGRAAMEFMDRMGATEGFFLSPLPDQETLWRALGYARREDGSLFLDTTGFFTEHCQHHEEHPFT